jgi:phosphatidylglycerophosphatase A
METRQRDPFSARSRFVLGLAQGFCIGRIPVAPGLFGSLLGLVWFAALILGGSLWVYLAGMAGGFAVSIWIGGAAEEILRRKDPSSVVIDEITAVPLCFLPWVVHDLRRHQVMPSVGEFFGEGTWYFTVAIFILFRVFDVVKPWPVRQAQSLPGGWGVTVDDVLAAVYVALIAAAFFFTQ